MSLFRWIGESRAWRLRLGGTLLAMVLPLVLARGDREAWAARRPPSRPSTWPVAVKGGLYLKLEKYRERQDGSDVRIQRHEDTAAITNLVMYLRSYADPVQFDSWSYALPGEDVPQTGRMALLKLLQYETRFTEYGNPCTQTYTLRAAEEDVAVADHHSTAILMLERRLSSRVWKVFARAWAPVVATETFTNTCGDSRPSTFRNVNVDVKVEGTLTRTGSGRRLRYVLRGDRTYQDGNDPHTTVKESLQGTFLPVNLRR